VFCVQYEPARGTVRTTDSRAPRHAVATSGVLASRSAWSLDPLHGFRLSDPAHTTVYNHHRMSRFASVVVSGGRALLENLEHSERGLIVGEDAAEADVLACELALVVKREEELRCVRVLAAVAHREHAALVQLDLQPHRVVLEAGLLAGEDALAAAAVVFDKVAALRHETLDDAVEVAAYVRHLTAGLLPLAAVTEQQSNKVFDGERRYLRPEFNVDALGWHLHRTAALCTPLKVIRIQLLLNTLQFRATEFRQPITRQVICGNARSDSVSKAPRQLAETVYFGERTCEIFGSDEINCSLVRGTGVVHVDIEPAA